MIFPFRWFWILIIKKLVFSLFACCRTQENSVFQYSKTTNVIKTIALHIACIITDRHHKFIDPVANFWNIWIKKGGISVFGKEASFSNFFQNIFKERVVQGHFHGFNIRQYHNILLVSQIFVDFFFKSGADTTAALGIPAIFFPVVFPALLIKILLPQTFGEFRYNTKMQFLK